MYIFRLMLMYIFIPRKKIQPLFHAENRPKIVENIAEKSELMYGDFLHRTVFNMTNSALSSNENLSNRVFCAEWLKSCQDIKTIFFIELVFL